MTVPLKNRTQHKHAHTHIKRHVSQRNTQALVHTPRIQFTHTQICMQHTHKQVGSSGHFLAPSPPPPGRSVRPALSWGVSAVISPSRVCRDSVARVLGINEWSRGFFESREHVHTIENRRRTLTSLPSTTWDPGCIHWPDRFCVRMFIKD